MVAVLLFVLFFCVVSWVVVASRQWWICLSTQSPPCTYYFGPFKSQQEAIADLSGYVADLEAEGATGITSQIERRYPPRELTLEGEE